MCCCCCFGCRFLPSLAQGSLEKSLEKCSILETPGRDEHNHDYTCKFWFCSFFFFLLFFFKVRNVRTWSSRYLLFLRFSKRWYVDDWKHIGSCLQPQWEDKGSGRSFLRQSAGHCTIHTHKNCFTKHMQIWKTQLHFYPFHPLKKKKKHRQVNVEMSIGVIL